VDVALGIHDVVRPDVGGWRKERLPKPGQQRPIDVVPDWICEILSPSTAARDRVQKRHLYARAGVRYYWIIDPDVRVLEALELKSGVWIETGVYDETHTARIVPFDAIELTVGRFFLPREADEP
jgi:Uma2 family endonuclease